jgi:glycosyltransferase involved in cell wall biosynthesis
VVLTNKLRNLLVADGLASAEKIEVVPCCVDFDRFAASSETLRQDRFEVIYAGSVVGLYLLEEMGRFFLQIRKRRSDALLRILTTSRPEPVLDALRVLGLSTHDVCVGPAKAAQVPSFLRAARIGLSFRKPTFSQIAASPTKIPEYLAAGLPVVCNAGIGDADELIESQQVGVVVRRFDESSLAFAAEKALALTSQTDIATRCISVARSEFDLKSVGAAAYRRAYARLQMPRPYSDEGVA